MKFTKLLCNFRKVWLRSILLAACLLCSSFSVVNAAPPQSFVLENMLLRADASTLMLNFSVSVDDEDGLRDLLKDGANLELTLNIAMQRQRSWWMNADVTELVYVSFLRHNPLTREFTITMPRTGGDVTLKDRNLTRLIHKTWRTYAVPVVAMSQLSDAEKKSSDTFSIKVSLSLRHSEVPPWLEKSPAFWSSDVVPKVSYTLEYSPHSQVPQGK